MNNTLAKYSRGEIWWVRLDPSVGVEAAKRCDPASAKDARERASRQTRACLILQNDAGNRASQITTVVPFLAKKDYLFVVNVAPTPENGLDKERGLHMNQIRSVDNSRVVSKIGVLEDSYWQEIKTAIEVQLGFF